MTNTLHSKNHLIRIMLSLVLIGFLVLSDCTPAGKGNTATNQGEKREESNIAQQPTQQINRAEKQEIAQDGELVIPLSEITEDARFYPLVVDGVEMEVLAVKTPDGAVRTAFNTCQVCYDSGRGYYIQEGKNLICQNCGSQFPMKSVEIESGGCNPWPIFIEDKTVTDESITISYTFLKESVGIFKNWKVNA